MFNQIKYNLLSAITVLIFFYINLWLSPETTPPSPFFVGIGVVMLSELYKIRYGNVDKQ